MLTPYDKVFKPQDYSRSEAIMNMCARWLAVIKLILSFGLGAYPLHAADPRDSRSYFGVIDFLPWDYEWAKRHYDPGKIEKAASLMQEAGIEWIRIDFVWSDVEPKKGRFDFAKYDRIIEILDR